LSALIISAVVTGIQTVVVGPSLWLARWHGTCYQTLFVIWQDREFPA